MVDAISGVASWVLAQFDHIWTLYVGGSVLVLPLLLWVMDRLFHIFDVIKR